MDVSTIDCNKFTPHERLDAFRGELATFVRRNLGEELAVLVRITTQAELTELAGAKKPEQLFNYAKSPNPFVGGTAFIAHMVRISAMAAKPQDIEGTTYYKDYITSEDEKFLRSFIEAYVVSFKIKGDIVVVCVGGFINEELGRKYANLLRNFLGGKLSAL